MASLCDRLRRILTPRLFPSGFGTYEKDGKEGSDTIKVWRSVTIGESITAKWFARKFKLGLIKDDWRDPLTAAENEVEKPVEDESEDEIDDVVTRDEHFDSDEDVISPISLTEGETKAVAALARLGVIFKEKQSTEGYLEFGRLERKERFSIRRETSIHRRQVPELLTQLESEIVEHPAWIGFMQPPTGYAEIVIDDTRRAASSSFERFVSSDYDVADCPHVEEGKDFPTVPFKSRTARSESEQIVKRIHLAGPEGTPCVEISNASPLGMLLYGRSGWGGSIPLLVTAKVDCGESLPKESLITEINRVIRSFAYELDVRNGRIISAKRRPLPQEPGRSDSMREKRVTVNKVRYPETRIQPEVADLFGFASQASDNPPLAFLSYYQTLEYFLPAAIRQSVLKKVRLELRDPTFDRDSDRSLLRLISTAESMIRIPESNQLRTLVQEYVRRDRLEEFFARDWGNHFTYRGPIKGVENINVKNSSKGLSDQIADRVYQIRNRIVHAKDDPRYEDARVLLPRSQEAEALGPDVQLVRLLAMEAIVAGQGNLM